MEFLSVFKQIQSLFDSNSEELQMVKDDVASNTSNDSKKAYSRSIFTINGVEVYFVNGCEVKDKMYMDFVEGGNDQVYGDGKNSLEHFMPSGKEIWLDAHVDLHELPYIAFHEYVERYHMENYDMKYDDAHEIANKEEKKARDMEMKKAFNLNLFLSK